MEPDWSRRNALRTAGTAVAVALAGCSVVRGGGPEADASLGGTDYDPIVRGQPTVDDGVPSAWGLLVGHPDVARKLVDWPALTASDSEVVPGAEFREFDPDEQFVSVVVGVLPTGYGLAGYEEESDSIFGDIVDDFRRRPAVADGRLALEVTPHRAFEPEPGDPAYHYDYTFTRWRLNGADRPEEISVELRDA